jgi:hypothetical protein
VLEVNARERKAERDRLRNEGRRSPAVKRLYEVVGNRSVNGRWKGERLELELTEAQERHLIGSGHVRRVEEPEPELKTEKRAVKAPVKKGPSNG